MIRELAASLPVLKQADCFIDNPSSQLSWKVHIINPILQRKEIEGKVNDDLTANKQQNWDSSPGYLMQQPMTERIKKT